MAEPPVRLQDQSARYLSCRFIEGELYLFHASVRFCCMGRQGGLRAPRIPRSPGAPPDMEVVERERQRLRADNNGSRPPCGGCPHLTRDAWNRRRGRHAFHTLSVSSSLACNLKCTYCDQVKQLAHRPDLAPLYRLVPAYGPQVARILRDGWLAPGSRVTLSGGEPTLVRDFEPTLRLLLDHGLRVSVLTNATVFAPVLRDLLAAWSRVHVVTSIDCGTPERYAAMKGKDLFWRAITNLGVYARTGGHVTAKYIISSINTEEAELTAFAGHLRREGIRRAAIAIDTDPEVRFPESGPHAPVAAMLRLRDVLWRCGVHVTLVDYGLNRGFAVPRRPVFGRRFARWWRSMPGRLVPRGRVDSKDGW